MHNLIIIGNGFDLAHGLKTSYNDYLRAIIDRKSADRDLYPDLLKPDGLKVFPNYDRLKEIQSSTRTEFLKCFNNLFFKRILESNDQNWCDIEKLYFQQLNGFIGDYSHGRSSAGPKSLNEQFETVKFHLEEYLTEEQEKFNPINSYKQLFDSLNSTPKTIILNFNYNRTNEITKNNKTTGPRKQKTQ